MAPKGTAIPPPGKGGQILIDPVRIVVVEAMDMLGGSDVRKQSQNHTNRKNLSGLENNRFGKRSRRRWAEDAQHRYLLNVIRNEGRDPGEAPESGGIVHRFPAREDKKVLHSGRGAEAFG